MTISHQIENIDKKRKYKNEPNENFDLKIQ